MRTFLIVDKGGAGYATGTLEQVLAGIPEGAGHALVLEVADETTYTLPTQEQLNGSEDHLVLEISVNSTTTHLDLAGVQRDAGGHVVDATPGSYDAAKTGMVHDLGNRTVKNTNSVHDTPSPVISKILDPTSDEATEVDDHAPQADPAKTRGTAD